MTPALEQQVRDHPFFAALSPAAAAAIAGCGAIVHHATDAVLAREGDPADTFHAVLDGRLAIRLTAPGREPLTLGTAEAGEVVGWSWLFAPHRWQYDIVATVPTTTIRFNAACLRGTCDGDPVLGQELMKRFASLFARRLADARLQLLDLHAPAPRA